MPVLGKPLVEISLDYDTLSTGISIDGERYMTVMQEFQDNDTDDLNLPADNLVLGFSYQYGRDRFIVGDFETGTATLVLNNDSGEFTPGSGVNEIGGDKLEPGMQVRVGWFIPYAATAYDIEDYFDDHTGDSSWRYGSVDVERDVVDAETWEGFRDGGRTWTAHVDTPADIELNVQWIDNHKVSDSDTFLGNFAAWRKCRFMGRIQSIEDQYEEGGRGAITVVEIADVMADLAIYEPQDGISQGVEDTDQRITEIFGSALVGTGLYGNIQTGLYDIEDGDLSGNYLQEARDTAAAEGGAVFADHSNNNGEMVFKAANWLIEDPRSAVVQAYIGDARIGITSARTDYSLLRVYNDLYYSNSSTTKNEADATSETRYGTRALRRDVLNNSATDLETLAERDLALLKDPKLVITQVTIRPNNWYEEVFCSNVSIGDRLHVTVQNDGWSYQQELHVSGIAESFDAASDDWTVQLRLDSRDGDTVVS